MVFGFLAYFLIHGILLKDRYDSIFSVMPIFLGSDGTKIKIFLGFCVLCFVFVFCGAQGAQARGFARLQATKAVRRRSHAAMEPTMAMFTRAMRSRSARGTRQFQGVG